MNRRYCDCPAAHRRLEALLVQMTTYRLKNFVHFEPVAFVEPEAGPAAVVAPAVAAATELFPLQHAAGLEGRQLALVAV